MTGTPDGSTSVAGAAGTPDSGDVPRPLGRGGSAAARRVVVVGAGVVGSAVAAELAAVPGVQVVVLERGPAARLVGSTGYAPGLLGLLGDTPVLTALARASADAYEGLRWHDRPGLDRVGGLEVAQSPAALAELERRAERAAIAGLPARLLGPAETAAAAPDLVDPAGCLGGLLFPHDGTVRARAVTLALQERARRAGARFVHGAEVVGIDAAGARLTVDTPQERHPADDVVLACGIWGRSVGALAGLRVPLVPVAHPYVHGPLRQPSTTGGPFVRWPEHHVYARDHGDRLGLGTYDHRPVPVADAQLGATAELPWPPEFEDAVEQALRLLPPEHRRVDQRLNGVFSMTADNLPLLGPAAGVPGLWVAEALWVTHAAGAARCVAAALLGDDPGLPGLAALRPDRFDTRPEPDLTDEALRLYRDIYATATT